jgi:hypothetical protein
VRTAALPAVLASWPALIAAWIALVAALVFWLLGTPPAELRDQLMRWQFWSLEACALVTFAAWTVAFRDLRRQLSREDVFSMAGLSVIALTLVVFVAPRTNRIYYDEHIYQAIGHNLADTRHAQMCLDGNVEYGRLECAAGVYNKQPYAYPHLLSLVYRVGGVNAGWAFAVNATAMVLSVCGVYLLTLLLFADRWAALFAGLILGLTPHQILWSATAAVEPLASLGCILALLSLALFARTQSAPALIAVVAGTAYAVQFRMESLLIIPVAGLMLLHLAGDEYRRARFWWVVLVGLALVAVHIGHVYSVRSEGWGTTDARLSWRYVIPNFRVNGGFYAGDERFPIIYTALALVGLFARGRSILKGTILLYFLVFFGIGLLFYAGSYNYGADVRYSLMTYPPLAVLGGLGAAQLAQWIHRDQLPAPSGLIVLAALALQFLWYVPLVRATTQEAWAARADVRFAVSSAALLPENSYVLTHNPGMFHLWGVNAGQMSLVVDSPSRLEFLAGRYAGGVYLHWNFWCNVAVPVQQEFCRKALALAASHPFKEYRERDQRFGLYRFDLSKPVADDFAAQQGSGRP